MDPSSASSCCITTTAQELSWDAVQKTITRCSNWCKAKAGQIDKDPALQAISGIVAANTAVFLGWRLTSRSPRLQLLLHEHFTSSWEHLRRGRVHTLATSSISHHGTLHLLFNMAAFVSLGTALVPQQQVRLDSVAVPPA